MALTLRSVEPPGFPWHYGIWGKIPPDITVKVEKNTYCPVKCYVLTIERYGFEWPEKFWTKKPVMFAGFGARMLSLMFGSIWVNVLSLGGGWRGPYKRVELQEGGSNAREKDREASLWANQVGERKPPSKGNRKNEREQGKKHLLSGMALLPTGPWAWYVANHCRAMSWSPN